MVGNYWARVFKRAEAEALSRLPAVNTRAQAVSAILIWFVGVAALFVLFGASGRDASKQEIVRAFASSSALGTFYLLFIAWFIPRVPALMDAEAHAEINELRDRDGLPRKIAQLANLTFEIGHPPRVPVSINALEALDWMAEELSTGNDEWALCIPIHRQLGALDRLPIDVDGKRYQFGGKSILPIMRALIIEDAVRSDHLVIPRSGGGRLDRAMNHALSPREEDRFYLTDLGKRIVASTRQRT